MANDNENDFGFEDWLAEVSPIEQARAAVALSDQMRNEEDLLAKQTAEEARLEQQWRQGPTSGVVAPGMAPQLPAAPVQGQYGQVMPTSRGFMYMGNPIPGSVAPPIPTDQQLWQQKVAQSVADTGNIPLPEPSGGWFGPTSAFTPNVPSIPQQQYELTQSYLREQNPQAKQQHLAALVALTGRGRSPVYDDLRRQQEERLQKREERIAGQVPAYVRSIRTDLQKSLNQLKQQRIAALGGDDQQMVVELDKEINDKQRSLNDLDTRWMPSGGASLTTVPTPTTTRVEPPESSSKKTLDRATAQRFLTQAKGDKAKARALARAAGYDI